MVIFLINDILNTNFKELLEVSYRVLFAFIILFFVTKLIGKKQVSELNLFDYVISISIGNFAAEIAMNLDYQVMNGIVSVILFGLIASIVSFLTMKSIILRRFFTGEPIIIIQDGKFIYKNLKKAKIDLNDFLESARISGYFDISEIKYALMEANGKISFLKKEENNLVTLKDLKLKASKKGLCANVIIDGKVMKQNLKLINKNETWLKNNLKDKGYKTYENILLATIDINNKITIYEKENDKSLDVLE